MEIKLTAAEVVELARIHVDMNLLYLAPDEALNDMALNEIEKEQPILKNLAYFLYQTKKFSMEQMMEISRLLIVIYWYYKNWSNIGNKKIGGPLYDEMRMRHDAFEAKFTGKSAAKVKQMVQANIEKFPGRVLYGEIQRTLFKERTNSLATASKANKHMLITIFKITMDCFESLIDRENGVFNVN